MEGEVSMVWGVREGEPGKPVVGILMLESPHMELPGALASDHTFPFPVSRREVRGATVQRMLAGAEGLEGPMLEAARALECEGVSAIIGNCGLMSLFQKGLQESLNVPVFTSSLLWVPLIAGVIPKGRRVGILTIHSKYLREAHFQGAGWVSDEIPIAIAGVEEQSAWQHPLKWEQLEGQLLDVCRRFTRDHPDLGALVLECTVMPPFAPKIRSEISLPVFDITLMAELAARSFCRSRSVVK